MRDCRIILILLSLFSSACRQQDKKHIAQPPPKKTNTVLVTHHVALLPFRGIDSNTLAYIKSGIEKRLSVSVTVLEAINLPVNAFYKPRMRYIADSLLIFLNARKEAFFEKIIGITTKDISTRKGDIANWGILGLGSCPGTSCVISSFRAGKNKVTEELFYKRMVTLALHELGHTYGLEHCPDNNCLMKDAAGKMNLDDGDSYCKKCKLFLNGKGVLN